MKRLPELIDLAQYLSREKLALSDGQEVELTLVGYRKWEGNWGEVVTLYLDGDHPRARYYLHTRSQVIWDILDALDARQEEKGDAYPVRVKLIRRGRRIFME